jgi:Fe2+ or Zn2+ uptake regulation protein/DNA-binding MarR family transcriptional regulator
MKQIVRMTHQREVLIEELGKLKGHPTADILYERIKKKLPRISLATVYRNLEILSEAGMIRKLEISGRQKRFDRDIDHHSHVYCIQCQRVDNIKLDQKQVLAPESEEGKGYIISGYRIEFSGICPDCQNKNTRAKQRRSSRERTRDMSDSLCNTRVNERQHTVLAAVKECGAGCNSKDIAAACESTYTQAQVSCQLTVLKKKGLIISPMRCQYTITKEGEAALAAFH